MRADGRLSGSLPPGWFAAYMAMRARLRQSNCSPPRVALRSAAALADPDGTAWTCMNVMHGLSRFVWLKKKPSIYPPHPARWVSDVGPGRTIHPSVTGQTTHRYRALHHRTGHHRTHNSIHACGRLHTARTHAPPLPPPPDGRAFSKSVSADGYCGVTSTDGELPYC